jgi:hypothetical protein
MAGYIGSKASVVSSGAERKKTFAITTSTTSLTGLVYTPTKAHVFHNGVRLVDGTDYTATNGTSITLTSAAENGDEVVVISYAGFQVADAYTQAEADAEFVAKAGDTMTGGLTVEGADGELVRIASTVDSGTQQEFGIGFASNPSHTHPAAQILAKEFDASDSRAGLNFYTRPNNSDTASVKRMCIDSAGRVTMPYQPAFHAYGTGATSSMTTAHVNPVHDVTVFNIGNCYNTTTGVFTAQVGGVYYFATGVYMFANSGHNRLSLSGSTGTFHYKIASPNSAAHSETLTGTIYLNAGDTCYPQIQSDSSSTYYRAQNHSWFEGHLVG